MLDNLGTATTGSLSVDASIWWAVGFELDAGPDAFLDSVTLTAASDVGPSSFYRVQIFDSLAGAPGSVIATLTSPSVDAAGDYTFTPGSALQLSAATEYWVVSSSSDPDDLATFSYFNRGAYTESGATFNVNGTLGSVDGGLMWGATGDNLSLQLDVTAVPEPATYGVIAAFFLFGAALLHSYRQRKRAQA